MSRKEIRRNAVKAILLTPDKRVLLIQWQEPKTGIGFWSPPGGGIESNETDKECLFREVYEETGLKDFSDFMHIWNRHVEFTWNEDLIIQDEKYFLIYISLFEPTMKNNPERSEADSFIGFNWWSIEDIEKSDELFLPVNIEQHLKKIINKEIPDYPITIE